MDAGERVQWRQRSYRWLAVGIWLFALGACSYLAPVSRVDASHAMRSSERPQLSAAQAQRYTVAKYLAQAGTWTGLQGQGLVSDGWDPAHMGPLGQAGHLDAVRDGPQALVVAADGSGTHRTVQAAVDAVPQRSHSDQRYYIEVRPGTYRETVCALNKAPITLYGSASDAQAVAIVGGNYNGKAKSAHVQQANACSPNWAGSTYGTSGSATFAVFSDAFHARHISFVNDAMQGVRHGVGYPPGASGSAGAQAVALMTQGDRLVFDNVRVLGHQDSLYVKTAHLQTVSRVYFRDSFIQGDVDFVFGRAVLVLDRCTLHFTSARLPLGQSASMLAPSTAAKSPFGILVRASRFTADPQTPAQSVYLGRAWDEGIPAGTYTPQSPINGQLVVRDSTLGAHVRSVAPWGASTSARPFSSAGNRFAEFNNKAVHAMAFDIP